MIYVGGLRGRLIRESIYQAVNTALDDLGWFDAGRKHTPIQFIPTGVDDNENIDKNVLVLADWDLADFPEEMGSDLAEHRTTYYLDFYAEDDAIGLHMGQDLRDIMAGRITAIGRNAPRVDVYDWTMATPSVIFTVQIEDILIDRPEVFERPWQRFLRSVRFDVVDYYGNDEDA